MWCAASMCLQTPSMALKVSSCSPLTCLWCVKLSHAVDFVAGRLSTHFDDRNEGLLDLVEERHPSVVSCEMETNHL